MPVLDLKKAIEYYCDKLGFERAVELPSGITRSLSVMESQSTCSNKLRIGANLPVSIFSPINSKSCTENYTNAARQFARRSHESPGVTAIFARKIALITF